MKPPRIPWVVGPDPTGLVVAVTGDQIAYAGPVPAPKLTGAEHYAVEAGRIRAGRVSAPLSAHECVEVPEFEARLAAGITTFLVVVDLARTSEASLRDFQRGALKAKVRAVVLFRIRSGDELAPELPSTLIDPTVSRLRAAWLADGAGEIEWEESGRPIFFQSHLETAAGRSHLAGLAIGRRLGVLELGGVGDIWVEEANGLGPAWVAGEPVFRPPGTTLPSQI